MSNLYEWFHDDITWCGNECSYTECERNQTNMLDKTGLHSYALFKDTESCPLSNKRAKDQYNFWANNPNVEFLHNINLNDTGEIGEWTIETHKKPK